MNKTRQFSLITNSCECTDENGESTAVDCYGCWDDMLEEFKTLTKPLFDIPSRIGFHVAGLPLWNRNLEGDIYVDDVEQLLAAITINGDWRLQYCVEDDNVENGAFAMQCILSHHDVPTGRGFMVSPILSTLSEDDE